MVLQVHVSYGSSEEDALRAAHDQWRTNVFESRILADLRLPADFEAASALVQPEDLRPSVLVSADAVRYVDWLAEYVGLGFDEIYVHNVHADQESFLEAFGQKVLPQLT